MKAIKIMLMDTIKTIGCAIAFIAGIICCALLDIFVLSPLLGSLKFWLAAVLPAAALMCFLLSDWIKSAVRRAKANGGEA